MKHHWLRSVSGTLLLVATALPIDAAARQHTNYLPLTKSERGKTFRLKLLGEVDLKLPVTRVSIGPSGAGLRSVDHSLIIEGRDKRGKRWTVYPGVRIPGIGGRIYAGDLDKDGSTDLVILVYTGGNGLAPTTHFISVLFDARGRPATFEADGYFGPDEAGLEDLIDIDGDGKAELIYMNFDDGYWITNLYKAHNAKWKRITGRYRGRTLPLFTRFTRNPNHRAVKPMAGRHPFGPNLANADPLYAGRLVSFRWNEEQAGLTELTIMTQTGKKTTCSPDLWYSTFAVAIDNASGREIASLGSPSERVKSLLDRIVRERYRVALFGQRSADHCSPELLWAGPKDQ